jgi:small-conductance mechanosensitive channel
MVLFLLIQANTIWEHVLHDWHGDMEMVLRQRLPKIVTILVLAALEWFLLNVLTGKLAQVSRREEFASQTRAQQLRTVASVVHSLGMFFIFFNSLLQILPVFEIDVKPLLASAGIAGLAIGFGAQTMVHDVINGFLILIENSYGLGDTVKIAGVQGTVEQMSLRKTVLRDESGAVHSVPNSSIQIISNLTRDWAQITLQVSVDYSEPSDKIIGLLKNIATELHHDSTYGNLLVAEPDVPGIDRVNGSEVDYLIVAKVRPGKQFTVKRELRKRIKENFEKNRIKAGTPNRMYVLEAPASTTQS